MSKKKFVQNNIDHKHTGMIQQNHNSSKIEFNTIIFVQVCKIKYIILPSFVQLFYTYKMDYIKIGCTFSPMLKIINDIMTNIF